MNDDGKTKQADDALMSAMTTEHIVMQTAISGTLTEANSRATIYVMALSSALVALGFAASSASAFVSFIACVLPATFVLGVFTVLRMVDIASENMQAHINIARIRAFYRERIPGAAELLRSSTGRWPEGHTEPSLRIGKLAGYFTTAAMMIATINSFVAGVGMTFLAVWLGGGLAMGIALGAAVAVVLNALFFVYQRWRIDELADRQERAT